MVNKQTGKLDYKLSEQCALSGYRYETDSVTISNYYRLVAFTFAQITIAHNRSDKIKGEEYGFSNLSC